MALLQGYTGEDYSFTFNRLQGGVAGQYVNLDNYLDIIVYVSNGKKTVKFKKVASTGYTALVRVDQNNYQVQLSSANTRYLGNGIVTVKYNFVSTDLTIADQRLNKIAAEPFLRLERIDIGEEN